MAEEISECPICGADVEEGATECPACGEPFEDKDVLEEEKELTECPICGAEVEEGEIECPGCGELLEEDEDKRKAIERLTNISGLGSKRAIKLYEEGFKEPEDIVEAGMKGLAAIDQIGVRTARKIIEEAEILLEEEEQLEEEPEGGVEEEDIVEPQEPLEGIEEGEEKIEEKGEEEFEVVESITEDLRGTLEEAREKELMEGPKRVIVGDNIRKNPGDLVPVLSAFLIPLFLLILVASEFVVVLLDYTSIYPANSLYYLTPLPFLVSSWIFSITLSFLIVLVLFIITLVGYDFRTLFRLNIDKSMIFLSAIISVIISVSLIAHIYQSQMYSGIILTFVLLILSLFMLVNQLELLRKKYTLFPRIEEKKACMECAGVMDLDLENCPQCGSNIAVIEESISKVDNGVVWASIISLFHEEEVPKEMGVPEAPEGISEASAEVPEEIPEWEEEEVPEAPEEEVPEWEEEVPEAPEEEVPEWEEEEVPEAPEEEIPEWEEEEVPEAPEEEVPEWEEEEVPEAPEEEVPEWEEEEVPEAPEEEEPEWKEEEVPEAPEEEVLGWKEEEGGISSRLGGLTQSIREGWSSTVSFFQSKLRRSPKAPEEEEIPEEVEEVPEWEEGIPEEEEVLEEELPEEEVEEVPEEEVEEVPEEEVEEVPEEELEEEITELEEEVTELEEILKEEVEEELPEEGPEEEVPEVEEEEEVPKWEEELPEEEGGVLKSLSGIANSIQGGLSSTASFIKKKLGKEPENKKEETPIEEKFEDKEGKGICPSCGALIPSDSENCPECGEELEPSEEELGDVEEELEPRSALDELEKELEEVEEETESVVFVCPICDAELEEDVDECPECGTVFVEEEAEEESEEGIVEESLKESKGEE